MKLVLKTIGKSKLKPYHFYIGYNELSGFVVLGTLGYYNNRGTLDILLYPFAYIKGLLNVEQRKKSFFIDEDYLRKGIESDISYTLAHEFEYGMSTLAMGTSYSVLDYTLPVYIDLQSEEVKAWYLKNRMVNKVLPDLLYNVEKKKITKKSLEVGNLYVDNGCYVIYCYVGYFNEKYCFAEVLSQYSKYSISDITNVYDAYNLRASRQVHNIEELLKCGDTCYFKAVKTLPTLYLPNVDMVNNENMKILLSKGKLTV